MQRKVTLDVGDDIVLTPDQTITFRGMTLRALAPVTLHIEALEWHDPPAGTTLGDEAKVLNGHVEACSSEAPSPSRKP